MMDFESMEKELTVQIQKNSNCNRAVLALLHNNRGHAKYMQVEFDGAVGDYSKAIELNPKLSIAYYNRGTVLYRLGQFQDAIKDMKIAVELDLHNQEFHEGLQASLKYQNQLRKQR